MTIAEALGWYTAGQVTAVLVMAFFMGAFKR